MEVVGARQGREGLTAIEAALAQERPFQVAFVNMRMPPGWDGLTTTRHLLAADPDLQVVLCTAYSDYSWQQVTSVIGLTDRVLILKKPFDAVEVRQLVAALVERWSATRAAKLTVSQMKAMVDQQTAELRHASLHDALTGLANRRLLTQPTDDAIARRSPSAPPYFAVLFLDFDRFKVVNDSLGHEAGDRMLVQIAGRLCDTLRASDGVARVTLPGTAARLGGDEFVAFVDGLHSPSDVDAIADRLLLSLGTPYDLDGQRVQASVSNGVTTSDIGYASADEMIRDADTAMYRAKASGKNRSMTFGQNMHDEAMDRLVLENELRALFDPATPPGEVGSLRLVYQPIVELGSSRLRGVEALLRWDHPRRSVVPPAKFIPIAEENGVIVAAGAWVIEAACRELACRQRDGRMDDLFVSVNLSRRQLEAPGLVAHVRRVLDETGVRPEQLKLEIAESAVMHELAEAIASLDALQRLGVELYLDDFGTGYSSLSCLHRFPLHGLKIDRSFIVNLSERPSYKAVLQAIVTSS